MYIWYSFFPTNLKQNLEEALYLANARAVYVSQFTATLCSQTKVKSWCVTAFGRWANCDAIHHKVLHPPLTFQSSEHFLVTPTVSFNLTTPVVFFRFFMQPRKAGVEMLNLIRDTVKEERDQ